jgi:hypothetical protein
VTFALDPVKMLAGTVLQGHLGAHTSYRPFVQLTLPQTLSSDNDWHVWPGRLWVVQEIHTAYGFAHLIVCFLIV